MTKEQRLKNLDVPAERVDVVLDTDTFNEIDDQFALAYLLRSGEKLNTKAIYAAPFFNQHSTSPADGMERSYEEIKKVLALMNEDVPVFKGSDRYLPDEKTAVDSPAADDLIARAKLYTPEDPLYVVAIGAITNVASALIKAP
ncbi:MAG: nucleoside hydrolase, partial [Clostridia bacterium]|nr:nucleoside hydrolase [Clostridia bacterium]